MSPTRPGHDQSRPTDRAIPRPGPEAGAGEAGSSELTRWLEVQAKRLPGALSGLLLLRSAEGQEFVPAAVWPRASGISHALAEAIRGCLASGEARVEQSTAPEGVVPARPTLTVAHPLRAGKDLVGAVAYEAAPRPEIEGAALLGEKLAWGSAWFEAWILRQGLGLEAERRAQLKSLLDLMAAALEQERFQAAVTGFCTEVATVFGCDRASVGFVHRGRMRLQAISHSAHFGRRTNLVRVLENAMDECLEAGAALQHPAASEGPEPLARGHAELARLYGAGSVLSVPLVRSERVCGALTLEWSESAPPPAEQRILCETLGTLIGPLLELARQDARWIGARAGDSLQDSPASSRAHGTRP